MRIGILAPMPSELRAVVKALGLRRDGELGGVPLYAGSSGGVAVVATGTGIGPPLAAEATQRLLQAHSIDRVFVSGIAGGMIGASAVGDLVVPEEALDAATGERFRMAAVEGMPMAGVIRTGDVDSYRLTPQELHQLRDEGVIVLDMETAAIARVCAEHGIPCAAFRGISDMAGDASVGDVVMTLVRPDGTPDIRAAMRFLVRNPGRVPRMIRLGRESKAAAAVAGQAVADAWSALASASRRGPSE